MPQPTLARIAPILLGLAAVAGLGYAALRLLNPVGAEWQCIQGEAPATTAQGTRSCFPLDSELPEGFRWDPLGNRPLGGSCSGREWEAVAGPDGTLDCARVGADLPPGWRRVAR